MIARYPIEQYDDVMALPEPKHVLIEGNTIIVMTEEDLPPSPAVTVVTPRQARLALLRAGKLADVEAALQAMPGPEGEAARITWEYATEIHRNDPMIEALGSALGLTPAQIDALFEAAAKL